MEDIESLRGDGKLETIMENDDEGNIVMVDKQLSDDDEEVDDVTDYNQTAMLEDEFVAIRDKLDATEMEKTECFEQIKVLKVQLSENVVLCKEYQQEIDNLENEKSNYLFELNELKSEEERNILQKELKLYKVKEVGMKDRCNSRHLKSIIIHVYLYNLFKTALFA